MLDSNNKQKESCHLDISSEVTTSPNVFVAYVSGLGSLAVVGWRGTRPAYRGSEPFAMTVLEFLA